MCSGRVDLEFVLKAFANGMDGIFIGACRLGECNYVTHGNYHTWNMVLLCKQILQYLGLNPERLRIEFMSAGEGIFFTEVINDFGKKVETLGPLGKGEGIDEERLPSRIKEIITLVPYIKIVKREKLARRLDKNKTYPDFYTPEEIEALFLEVVSYHIAPDKCQACMICYRRCPVEAIDGGKNRVHIINQDKCIKCGTCLEVCPPRFGAVRKFSGEPVPPPIPESERVLSRKGKES
jgi:coenzyme F420-reducing hydrogenase delta subunit/ferredoxin